MWQLAEARNRFSQVFTRAMTEGPQAITRRGEEAVLISRAECDRLSGQPKPKMTFAEAWGDLDARLRGENRKIGVPHGLMAATALVHDLTLWTRNTKDFAGAGVRLCNPWED